MPAERPSTAPTSTPAWTRTAKTCLNEASPPIAALKIANRMPAMITATIGDDDEDADAGRVRHPPRRPSASASYISSFTVEARTTSCSPPADRSPAWRPASVVSGNALKMRDDARVVTASIPNHFGCATTLTNVSRGDVMTPMKRATRLFGAGAVPDAVGGVVISDVLKWRNRLFGLFGNGRLYHARIRQRPPKSFADGQSEPSRPVIVREKFG